VAFLAHPGVDLLHGHVVAQIELLVAGDLPKFLLPALGDRVALARKVF
jgi:hypothetical protein